MAGARILLLNPPTAAVSTEPLLNLGYLAAVLRTHGHTVLVVDATAPYRTRSEADVFRVISEFQPHFIGVTLTITFIPQSYQFLRRLAGLKVPVVVGGPHPNSRPKEALSHGADIVCIGEGEVTIVELAEHFLGQRGLASVNGICYKGADGGVLFTGPREHIRDLDTIPFPDFSDFPIKNYTGSDNPDSNPVFWSIFSSRGCPFNCIFCSSHNVFGRSIRLRSARNVFEEIRLLSQRFTIRSIAFQDDEILCSKQRFVEFCDLVASSGMKIKMSIRTRIDSINPEIIAKAKSAGITRFSFGIESWDDETLRLINKKYDSRTIHERFRYLAQAQPLPVFFNNICGFPWETLKHYRNIVGSIRRIPSEVRFFASVVTPVPYPQTELYDRYHEKYGFTDWWLKPEYHVSLSQSSDKRPFFMLFAANFIAMYSNKIYWNYSRRQMREIGWFTWKMFALFLQRHFQPFERALIYMLCRVSWCIWRRHPPTERVLFGILKRSRRVSALQQRAFFRDKYSEE